MIETLCHPLDTIKTRIQSARPVFEHGVHIRDLYKGVSTNIIGLPAGGTYFATYEAVKHAYRVFFNTSDESSWCHIVAGTMGEITSNTLRYFGE